MPMIVAVVCGIPGCGKSFLSKSIQDSLHSNSLDVRLFSFDDYQVQAELWDENTFKESRARAHKELEVLMDSHTSYSSSIVVEDDNLCTNKFNQKQLIIIDDIMYLRSMRKNIYNLCKRRNILMCVIWLKSTLEIALSQNHQRSKNQYIDENIITKIYNSFQPPIHHKYTHDRHCLVIDRSSNAASIDSLNSDTMHQELSAITHYLNTLYQGYDTLLAVQQQQQQQPYGDSKPEMSIAANDDNRHIGYYQRMDLSFRKISSGVMKYISQHLENYIQQQQQQQQQRQQIKMKQQSSSSSSSCSISNHHHHHHDSLRTIIAQSLSEAKSLSLKQCKELKTSIDNNNNNNTDHMNSNLPPHHDHHHHHNADDISTSVRDCADTVKSTTANATVTTANATVTTAKAATTTTTATTAISTTTATITNEVSLFKFNLLECLKKYLHQHAVSASTAKHSTTTERCLSATTTEHTVSAATAACNNFTLNRTINNTSIKEQQDDDDDDDRINEEFSHHELICWISAIFDSTATSCTDSIATSSTEIS